MQLTLLNAFLLVTAFMAFASFCTIGDMFAGGWKNKDTFDIKRFWSGMKWGLILYIFFLWLVGAVTVFPFLLSHFEIAEVDMTLLTGFSAYAVAVAFSGLSVKKLYNMGKNLFEIATLESVESRESTE